MNQNKTKTSLLEKELRILSDEDLLSKTFDLAKKEQQTTLSLLFHLKEVNERRSYALLSCSSLWEYTVKVLGYGESGASERINAMRLLTQVPALKDKLETGKMTLTTASQAQRFFQAERKILKKNYSAIQKLNVLNQIEGCSKREAEQKLLELSPEQVKLSTKLEKTRTVFESKTELKFVVDKQTMEMVNRVRELKGSDYSFSEIFKKSLENWLDQNDPKQKYSKKLKKIEQGLARKTDKDFTATKESQNQKQFFAKKNEVGQETPILDAPNKPVLQQKKKKPSRYIPIAVRRKVYLRAKGQCEYKSALNGKRCESKTRLQWEHVQPHALGGSSSETNIALLCFGHNQRRNIEVFGRQKIAKFSQTKDKRRVIL